MKKGAGKSAIAFLWDESFLWGITAYKALREAGLPFRLIRAADIGTGAGGPQTRSKRSASRVSQGYANS